MQISEAGREFICAWEKLRLDVYADGVGKWTVGWGHLIKPEDALRNGDRITVERAEWLFAGDLLLVEDVIFDECDQTVLAQQEFDALASFIFNCGANNFRTSTLLKKLKAGDMRSAADQFLRWNKGRQADGTVVELAGLTKRRVAERRMFLAGIYDATH